MVVKEGNNSVPLFIDPPTYLASIFAVHVGVRQIYIGCCCCRCRYYRCSNEKCNGTHNIFRCVFITLSHCFVNKTITFPASCTLYTDTHKHAHTRTRTPCYSQMFCLRWWRWYNVYIMVYRTYANDTTCHKKKLFACLQNFACFENFLHLYPAIHFIPSLLFLSLRMWVTEWVIVGVRVDLLARMNGAFGIEFHPEKSILALIIWTKSN